MQSPQVPNPPTPQNEQYLTESIARLAHFRGDSSFMQIFKLKSDPQESFNKQSIGLCIDVSTTT